MADRSKHQVLAGLSAKPADPKPLDPQRVMCVVKKGDRELGRVPAAARTAEAFITTMVRAHGECHVDYVEDAEAVNIHRMMNPQLW